MTEAATLRDEVNQRLRFRRFLLASAVSVLYLVVLAAFHADDRIDRDTLVATSAIVATLIVAFFALFRLGLNLRFRDPSLTTLQTLAAVFTMLFVVYRAPDTRLAFAAYFFVAMMFAMLRLTGVRLAALGFVSLASYALVTLARHGSHGNDEAMRLDLLQLLVMAVTFPWFVFIGMRVRRLQENDRRKDEFLATLAHELRNPLAPIRNAVDVLRTRGDTQSHGVVSMMERQLSQMTRLIDDLFDLSRISRGNIALHVERIDLRQPVQAAVEASRPLIEQMGHELSVSLPAEPVHVDGDPTRLSQVVSNLLNNSARYTPPGGRIALGVVQRDREVELTVADTGIGIPADRLESIFEMFTQVGGSVSAHAGLGIGLSLVKRLVAEHGGSIVARSKGLGHGSEFLVVLPAREPRRLAAPPPPPQAETRARARIVVVDDNRDAASSLSVLLELMGHEVRVANDGESAIALVERFRPQFVLLDLGMPGIDGYETCRRIRSQPWGDAMAIIAVTGHGDEQEMQRSAAAGFDAHFVKPLTPESLERLLSGADSPA
jgi:signal transduction histidine kinase/CheY-like chemotaxis protein